MQNENAPRPPGGVNVRLYAAAESFGCPAARPYWMRSISGCGCSMRTPIANALASSVTPARPSIACTSRAEWPVATTTARPMISPPSASRTPIARPPWITSSVARAPNRISLPALASFSRSAVITLGSLLEPTCGRASTRISCGAPCNARISMTSRTSPRLCDRVYSLPSEYVPAPPSPKQ